METGPTHRKPAVASTLELTYSFPIGPQGSKITIGGESFQGLKLASGGYNLRSTAAEKKAKIDNLIDSVVATCGDIIGDLSPVQEKEDRPVSRNQQGDEETELKLIERQKPPGNKSNAISEFRDFLRTNRVAQEAGVSLSESSGSEGLQPTAPPIEQRREISRLAEEQSREFRKISRILDRQRSRLSNIEEQDEEQIENDKNESLLTIQGVSIYDNNDEETIGYEEDEGTRVTRLSDIESRIHGNSSTGVGSGLTPGSGERIAELIRLIESLGEGTEDLGSGRPRESTPMGSSELESRRAIRRCETLAQAVERLKAKFDEEQDKSSIRAFRGREGDDPHMFLRKFENMLLIKRLDPTGDFYKVKALFYQYLQGPAEAWYAGLPNPERDERSPLVSWEALTRAFIRRFAGKTGLFMKKMSFEERVKEKGETVSAFMDDLLVKGRQLNKTDSEITSVMLRGVPKQWRNFVWGFGVSGLMEVMEKLRVAEATIPLGEKADIKIMAPEDEEELDWRSRKQDEKFQAMLRKIEGKIDQFEATTTQENQNPPKNLDNRGRVICYGCGGQGHYKRNCPSRGRRNGSQQGQRFARRQNYPNNQRQTDSGNYGQNEGNGRGPPM